MKLYLPDTHAVYWNEYDDPKLSPAARQAFVDAEQGRAVLISHPVVLAELYWMSKKLGQEAGYVPYVDFVRSSPMYRFDAVTLDDVRRLADFAGVPEMHDRLIVIAADRLGATIITNDRDIRSSDKAKCIW